MQNPSSLPITDPSVLCLVSEMETPFAMLCYAVLYNVPVPVLSAEKSKDDNCNYHIP